MKKHSKGRAVAAAAVALVLTSCAAPEPGHVGIMTAPPIGCRGAVCRLHVSVVPTSSGVDTIKVDPADLQTSTRQHGALRIVWLSITPGVEFISKDDGVKFKDGDPTYLGDCGDSNVTGDDDGASRPGKKNFACLLKPHAGARSHVYSYSIKVRKTVGSGTVDLEIDPTISNDN